MWDRNYPEDDQVYTWRDPDDIPDKWVIDDYEYPHHQLIRVDQVQFGVKPSMFEKNAWCPYFKIGVQTFHLQPVWSEDHAKWYVQMMKIAFNKLTIP